MNHQTFARFAVVLCGGRSSRMGFDKALLPFGHQTMIERIVTRLQPVVQKIVVVSRQDLSLPPLPEDVDVVFDERPAYGPLEGLRVGLKHLDLKIQPNNSSTAPTAFAFLTSCDAPLLKRTFVEKMFDSLGDGKIAVPEDGKFLHPLSAVYRTDLWSEIEALQIEGEHRPRVLFDRCLTSKIPVHDLRTVDGDLDSLFNLNSPDEFLRALKKIGLECPEEIRAKLFSD